MVSPADAQRLRLAQQAVESLVVADLEAMFASIRHAQPEDAARALRAYMPSLVRRYGEQSAAVAADWYDAQRALAQVPSSFRASMMASPYQDAVDPTVSRAVGSLFTDNPDLALTTLTAAAGKYVLAAGRSTITTAADRDPYASGWERVTRSGACKFCRMLHGRGAVYKKTTVSFAAHKHCNCAAVPSWDPDAPEVDVLLYQASARTTRMKPEQRARHNALIQGAIDRYVD